MRDLGTAGELAVQKWCALSGITATKPGLDRYGWDLLFETTSIHDVKTARGLHESGIECKIQVKTTDGITRTQPIELSNLRAMVTSSLPTFYLLLEFDSTSDPINGYLLHIDETHCERVLKRIREETVKSAGFRLNHSTMRLKFTNAMKILPLNGEGLMSAIANSIGISQASYVINKQNMLRRIGYETGHFKVKFDINKKDIQQLVEMTLGTSASLPVTNVKSFLTRFGITEELPELKSDTAFISVTSVEHDNEGTATFRNRKSGDCIVYSVKVYRAGFGNWAPPENRTIRLKGDRFSIDVYPHKNSFKIWFHDGDNSPADVKDLLKSYRFMQLMSDPKSVIMELGINGIAFKGSLGGEGFEGEFDYAIHVLESTLRIQHFFDVYDQILATPMEIQSIAEQIISLAKFLYLPDTKIDMTVKFCVDTGNKKIFEAECIFPVSISYGGIQFVALYVLSGDLNSEIDSAYVLHARQRKLLYKTFFNSLDSKSSKVPLEIRRIATEYKSDIAVIDLSENFILPKIKNEL
jgi:hypothetical protein